MTGLKEIVYRSMLIQSSSIQAVACAYEQTDQAFRHDARWLGSDTELSTPLSQQRHPEIRGKDEGEPIITYATNRFDFREVITP